MEHFLKSCLNTKILTPLNRSGGGCISRGEAYQTDYGDVFVKMNTEEYAKVMFNGEFEGLKAIADTGTVRVPKPMAVLDHPAKGNGAAMLVMEFMDFKSLSHYAEKLGDQLASLHLHNIKLGEKNDPNYVSKFGFHTTTCCGAIPLDNAWSENWVTFYTVNRLENQLERAESKYHDKEAGELWSQLRPKIPKLFEGITVKPSLLHGDLWGGNAAEINDGAVVFDCATFYGHAEFELAIAGMFGGFNHNFYAAYHKQIPKEPGYEDRKDLYQLFHYLNHWNHFGGGYRSSSMSIMRRLIKKF